MNRLSNAASPYLLQHRDNPVDWWEWGDSAFAEAKRLDRPVLLSVGYAACHWCHVMAHESFEDDEIAALMNVLFVNIKVDREERPDVDHLYMSALHALGEQGGWPLTMFLTPEREPFWGGTYFPKTARYGRPGFGDLLQHVAEIYRREPDRIRHNTLALTAALAQTPAAPSAEPTNQEFLIAARQAATVFDIALGGIRGAPKFPNAPILNMLWRAGEQDAALREPVLTTLRQMARGGIHDHLGGGFARYSVDEQWLAPHFEKMLYDNAQLLELYALAHRATGESIFRDAAHGVVSWLEREMIAGDGAFASSLDADSEGEEGLAYLWSRSEIESILPPADAALFARAYDVSEAGNFEGRNIPNLLKALPLALDEVERLSHVRETLLIHRARRVQPGRDDKVLADWNGLMIAALARAAAIMDRPEWIALARHAYRFIRESVSRDGRLAHSWRGSVGVFPAFALDHAAMALAALALAEHGGAESYLGEARRDLEHLLSLHSDSESASLAMTASDGDALIVRPRPTHDDATPNANGVTLEAMLRYAAMAMDDAMRARADDLIRALATPMRRQALAHASLWSVLDLRLNAAEIIVAGPHAEALMAAAQSVPYPNRIVTRLAPGASPPPKHPAHAMINLASERALAFVCRGLSCAPPVADPADLPGAVARRPA